LVRLEEPTDTEANRVVMRMPEGDFVQRASLPPSQDYVLTTPAELLVEDGRVVAAREGVKPQDGLKAVQGLHAPPAPWPAPARPRAP
jgi:hypothetical protein